jgi:hypothetical protein
MWRSVTTRQVPRPMGGHPWACRGQMPAHLRRCLPRLLTRGSGVGHRAWGHRPTPDGSSTSTVMRPEVIESLTYPLERAKSRQCEAVVLAQCLLHPAHKRVSRVSGLSLGDLCVCRQRRHESRFGHRSLPSQKRRPHGTGPRTGPAHGVGLFPRASSQKCLRRELGQHVVT